MTRAGIVDAAVAPLSAEEYALLVGRIERAVRQVVRTLTELPTEAGPDGAAKPGDVDDEADRRADQLRRVRAGQAATALVAEVMSRCAAEDATDAVWLGASLADLGESTGSTRQAARKRWPDLGRVYRTRRWVAGHVDDLVTVLRMVLAEASGYTAPAESVRALDNAVRELDQDFREVRRDLASGTVLDPHNGRPLRWRRLAEAVDVRLRAVVDLAVPGDPAADTALSAARGVLAHHDAVVAEPEPTG